MLPIANSDQQLVVQEQSPHSNSFDEPCGGGGDQREIKLLVTKASKFTNEKLILKRSFSLPLLKIVAHESKINRNLSF